MHKTIVKILPLFLLSGCILDNKSRQESTSADNDRIIINTPEIDTGQIAKNTSTQVTSRILPELNKNNAQLTGQITGQIQGMKTDIGKLFEANTTATLNITNNIETRLSELVKANIELSIQLNNQIRINTILNTEVQVKAGVIEKLQAEKISLETEVKAQTQLAANSQIGKNTFEQQIKDLKYTFDSKAGRDVNMYPPQAVESLKNTYNFFIAIITALSALATTIIGMVFKSSRQRAEQRYKLEKDRADKIFELLGDKI